MIQTDPKMVQKCLLRAAEILELGWCKRHFCASVSHHNAAGSFVQVGISVEKGQVGVDRFCIQGALIKAVAEVMGYKILRNDIASSGYWQPETFVAMRAIEEILIKDKAMPMINRILGESGEVIEAIPVGTAAWNDQVCQSGEEAASACRRAADALPLA